MRSSLILIAAVMLATSAAAAPAKDAAGKCRDNGKFVAATLCAAKPAAGAYKLDAKGNCHDAKGKMAKKALCTAK